MSGWTHSEDTSDWAESQYTSDWARAEDTSDWVEFEDTTGWGCGPFERLSLTTPGSTHRCSRDRMLDRLDAATKDRSFGPKWGRYSCSPRHSQMCLNRHKELVPSTVSPSCRTKSQSTRPRSKIPQNGLSTLESPGVWYPSKWGDPFNNAVSSLDKAPNEPIACPYIPGAMVMLERNGHRMKAVISHVYMGDMWHGFSNSCTVLLKILESTGKGGKDAEEVTDGMCGRELILKSFDWRFSNSPRDRYDCGQWGKQQMDELMKLSASDIFSFKKWLYEDVPADALSCKLHTHSNLTIENYFEPNVTRIDLYAYAIDHSSFEARHRLNSECSTYPTDPGFKEVFLHTLSEIQLAAEDQVAGVVSRCLPGYMPQTYGAHNISFGDQTSNPKIFQIRGILMERVAGVPVVAYPGGVLSEQTIRSFAQKATLFQLSLRRHHLDLCDTNFHNMIVSKGLYGVEQITFVDYGSIRPVIPEDVDIDTKRITLPFSSQTLRPPREFYQTTFDHHVEHDFATGLVIWLEGQHRDISHDEDFFESRWVNPYDGECYMTYAERILWSVLMLHVLFSIEEEVFRRHTLTALQLMQSAARILRAENTKDSDEPWWSRVVAKIAILTESDASFLHTTVSRMFDTVPNIRPDEEVENILVLRLVRNPTGQLRGTPPCLFPNVTRIINSMATETAGSNDTEAAVSRLSEPHTC